MPDVPTSSVSTESTSFRYSDFTPAAPRKKRKQKISQNAPSPLVLVQRAQAELIRNDWFTQCKHLLQQSLSTVSFDTPDVLCLGLGSPSSSHDARVQLALLLEICGHLDIDRTKVAVYDPVFTEEDRALLEVLKLRLLTENKHAEYPAEVPTILFMPHCDMILYENIIRANWSRDRLSKVLLISNRLNDYIDSNPTRKLETRVPCLLRIAPFLECHPLPTSTSWPTAFNNTSVQFVRPEALPSTSWFSEIPKQPEEPE